MRRFKTCAAIVTLFSIGLTAAQAKAGETPDIFDIIRESEYLKTHANEVPCDLTNDYPADEYLSLCFKVHPQATTDIEHLFDVAKSTGIEIGKIFGEADWAVQADDVSLSNPYAAFYPNSSGDACGEELFMNIYEAIIDLKELVQYDVDDIDFPIEFAPTFKFHKTIGSTCVM